MCLCVGVCVSVCLSPGAAVACIIVTRVIPLYVPRRDLLLLSPLSRRSCVCMDIVVCFNACMHRHAVCVPLRYIPSSSHSYVYRY
jgi:hypothetical protein